MPAITIFAHIILIILLIDKHGQSCVCRLLPVHVSCPLPVALSCCPYIEWYRTYVRPQL